jgi:homoserine kinase
MKRIKVKCPASLSNLVCGYDIFGMAVDAPYDTIELSVSESHGITIQHSDEYNLPTDPEKNIAGVALLSLMKDQNISNGFEIKINKQIKPGSGIGSSAASAAGIVVAADLLLNLSLTKKQLLNFAMDGEMIASSSRHADNLAPLIYGGLTLIRDAATFDIISIQSPPLFIIILHPQIEVKTSYAREILPENVPLCDAVKQWANTSAMVAGFLTNDYDLISRSMTDHIVEPVRSRLIPAFNEVKQKCLSAGALGGGISGSGPSMFMFSKDESTALKIEKAMKDVYENTGISYKTYVTTCNNKGVTEIS